MFALLGAPVAAVVITVVAVLLLLLLLPIVAVVVFVGGSGGFLSLSFVRVAPSGATRLAALGRSLFPQLFGVVDETQLQNLGLDARLGAPDRQPVDQQSQRVCLQWLRVIIG